MGLRRDRNRSAAAARAVGTGHLALRRTRRDHRLRRYLAVRGLPNDGDARARDEGDRRVKGPGRGDRESDDRAQGRKRARAGAGQPAVRQGAGDAKTTDDLYKIAGKLGYVALMEMTCRTGRLEVYTYRAPGPQQFSFMCLLHISRFCYSVLVTDLVSLLKLLDEIDAHLKEQVVATNSQKAEQTVNNARNAKGVNG